jgi:carboxymethylenebutenolidase
MGSDRQVQVGDRTARFHFSLPQETPLAGIVALHPWWGLNDDVIAYADRLAAAGFAVVAPDLYDGALATTIDEAERLSGSMDEAAAGANALAAAENLATTLGGPPARIGIVGFSMGAGWAIWLGGKRPEIAATVLYYGTNPGPSLARSTSPVLGHFAEVDPYEPPESVAAFEEALATA